MSLRRLVSARFALLATMLAGCGQSEGSGDSSCAAGEETCECYANGTCNAELVCLSAHCVDLSAGDAAIGDSGSSQGEHAQASRDAAASPSADEPSDALTDDGQHAPTQSNTNHVNPDDAGRGLNEQTAQDAVSETEPGADESSSANSELTEPSSAPSSTDEPDTDESSTPEGTSSALPTTDEPTTDEPTTEPDNDVTLADLAPLPPRAAAALDAVALVLEPSESCSAPTALDNMCHVAVECAAPDACLATFQWAWAKSTSDAGDSKLSLAGLSADGAVVVGDEVLTADSTVRNAFVWRWGSSSRKHVSGDWSSALAVNFDGTALAGVVRSCDDCDYVGALWAGDGWDPIPDELGQPTDLSDVSTVTGFNRHEDGVLWGYTWDGDDPVLAETLALQRISGDGLFAAGVADGGPVVLFYSNGTKAMPSTSPFRGDVVMDVTRHGEVVVGYGWGGGATYPMFRWQVDVGVDVLEPSAGFTEIVPFSLNETGSVMVGINRQDTSVPPIAPEDVEAFYWDESDGLRPFADELAIRGIELPDGMRLHKSYLSADGSTVVGEGFLGDEPILWRARLVQY